MDEVETIRQGSGKFTDQQPFIVTADDFKRPWGGRRGAEGMCCGFCYRVPEVGDVWRWLYVQGASNTFVCAADDGLDAAERFKVRWDTVIKPILRRWGDG